MGKPYLNKNCHPGQLNLAIPMWVGAVSTRKGWDAATGTLRDALVLYLWSRRVKTGVWLRALGNRDQCRPMVIKAQEELTLLLRFLC